MGTRRLRPGGRGGDCGALGVGSVDWTALGAEMNVSERASDEYNRGYEHGYGSAIYQSEQVRRLLTGWRPFAYVCVGFLAGFAARCLW